MTLLSSIFTGLWLTLASATEAHSQVQPVDAVSDDALGIVDQSVNQDQGRDFGARVIGGATAESGEYPSAVALIRPGIGDFQTRLFCGGTLVAERWVMTAAHCVLNTFNQPLDADRILVVNGTNDLAQNDPDRLIEVVRVIVHPDFDNNLDLPPNDIALIELVSDSEQPFTALFAGDTSENVGRLGFIAGWGATNIDDPRNLEFPSLLQDAMVPLIHNGVCNLPASYDGAIVPQQVCAGFEEGRVDACNGDSGGPLFIIEQGAQVQVGITSFGIGCAEPFFYGIYTDVSHFLPWLGEYIDVPFQSEELIERLANPEPYVPENRTTDDDDGLFGAAISPSGLIAWMVLLLTMRRVRSRS